MSQAVLNQITSSGGVVVVNPDLAREKLSAVALSCLPLSALITSSSASKLATDLTAAESTSLFNNNGAIDLTTDSKDPQAKLSATALLYQASRKLASSSSPSSHSSSSSPPAEELLNEEQKRKNSTLPSFTRSVSINPASFDSDNSQLQEITSAADLTKTSLLSLHNSTDQDGLVGCPRVNWKPGNQRPTEAPDSFLGVMHGGQWNGKGSKPVSLASKSRASSPSPVPSPTNSDASSTAEGRKVTTTSLSRTHSRSVLTFQHNNIMAFSFFFDLSFVFYTYKFVSTKAYFIFRCIFIFAFLIRELIPV